MADEREQYKDKRVQALVEEKDKIHGMKEEAEKEIENLTDKIQIEEEERKKRDDEDKAREQELD